MSLMESLNAMSQQINRSVAPIIFIFGIVGNVLNCCILSQRALRSNPCAQLFLASSFIGLISILIGLPTRILSGWDLDPTTTNNSICKFRAFTVFSTRTMAIWLIMFATVDRWLVSSTNVHRRRLSTSKNVKRVIIFSCLLSIASYTQMLYCYTAHISDAPLKCYGRNGVCRVTTALLYIFITLFIPLVLMIVFGLLTISNVRHVQIRVQHLRNKPVPDRPVNSRESRLKRTDRHLTRMLFLQVLLLIILCVPQAIEKWHITIQPFGADSESADAMKAFLYNIELLLAFIASGMSFYVNTLSGGQIYRKALLTCTQTIIRKITCGLYS